MQFRGSYTADFFIGMRWILYRGLYVRVGSIDSGCNRSCSLNRIGGYLVIWVGCEGNELDRQLPSNYPRISSYGLMVGNR